MDRLAGFILEAFFQIGTGHSHRIQYLLHLDPLAGMVTDIVHGLDHRWVAQ
ncbi:hypothetical protein D3C81_2114060 [compost metagenome]